MLKSNEEAFFLFGKLWHIGDEKRAGANGPKDISRGKIMPKSSY
jgi:hypothetical protein